MATYYRTGVETYSIIGTADERDSLEGRIPDGSTYFAVDENMFYTFYGGQWYETLPEAARLYHDDVGTDTRPIKLVGGVATVVANELAEDSKVVHNTGNETVAGVKTFTSNPIIQMATPAMSLKSNTQSTGNGRRATLTVSDVYGGSETMFGEDRWGLSSGGYSYRSLVLNTPDRSTEQYVQMRSYPNSFQIYSPTYYPVDESGNPRPPAADMLMTSGNIAVDPRLMHTTGNETIAGNKNFTGACKFDRPRFSQLVLIMHSHEWGKMYEINPPSYGSGYVVRLFDSYNVYNFRGVEVRFKASPTGASGYVYNTTNLRFRMAQRTTDGKWELWAYNASTVNIGVVLDVEYYAGNRPVILGAIGNEPVVGDEYTAVVDLTNQ